MNVESYRRRTALERKQQDPGRPASIATKERRRAAQTGGSAMTGNSQLTGVTRYGIDSAD
ncbi:IstB ATP binding domain-containing protein [Caballeronia catudaia]|uniref:IstB ATP binding domain-containing protein n=1 Tax=Caballeronia catudaia TaxID=1777136 RepID=A0A158D3G6_9BURK|nr:IstB ATP binding domain-containing protein [Caballeronia catudaia]